LFEEKSESESERETNSPAAKSSRADPYHGKATLLSAPGVTIKVHFFALAVIRFDFIIKNSFHCSSRGASEREILQARAANREKKVAFL
jgi:hypothetical protein